MSTVLWANLLIDGKVQSDQADYLALSKHADKLDTLTKALGLPSFLAVCDTTDLRFNADEFELPAGASSTDEVMAKDGAWLGLDDALKMLQGLLAHIQSKGIRFGLLSNQHDAVVAELQEVIAFASAASGAQKFNFCVVT